MLCNLFAEKQINRNVKNFRELNKHIKVGFAAAAFPKAYSPVAHTHAFAQCALRTPSPNLKFLRFFPNRLYFILKSYGNRIYVDNYSDYRYVASNCHKQ